MALTPQLMGLAAVRAWNSNFGTDDSQLKGRKRSISPLEFDSAKQQKLMALNAGERSSFGEF